jgi:hypothetical protein
VPDLWWFIGGNATKDPVKESHKLVGDWDYSVSEFQTQRWLNALLDSPNNTFFIAFIGGSVAGWVVVENVSRWRSNVPLKSAGLSWGQTSAACYQNMWFDIS